MVGGKGGPRVLQGCAGQVQLRQPALGHSGWDSRIVAVGVGGALRWSKAKGLGGVELMAAGVFLAMLSSPG